MANQFTKTKRELDAKLDDIKDLLLQGYSASEIAKLLGYGYAAIYNAICRNNLRQYIGVDKNGKSKSSREHYKNREKFDYVCLYEEYVVNKLDLYEIGRKYNTSPANVLLYMRKFGINTRTKSEAIRLQYEKNGDTLREKHRQNAYAGITGIHRKGVKRTETWIEKDFEKFCIDNEIQYKKQFQIESKGHRYDFLIYDKLLIELDGDYWHNTEKQRRLDEKHNLLANENGYDIIRFSDSDIKKTKGMCFERIIDYDNRRIECI